MTWQYAANLLVLLPVVALIVTTADGWRPPAEHLLATAGFCASAVADLWAYHSGGAPVVTIYYLPVQMWLVLWALLLGTKTAVLVLPALPAFAGLTFLSAALSAPGGDWLITLVGSVALLYASLRLRVLRWTVGAYFGLGTVAYLAMILTWGEPAMMGWWFAYQGCRLVALAALAGAVLQSRWGLPT